jgi:hypothetical protein
MESITQLAEMKKQGVPLKQRELAVKCQPLDGKAQRIFDVLRGLAGDNGSMKVDYNSTFMAVHLSVKDTVTEGYGSTITVAHYFNQNGDLMRDPEMEFIVTQTGKVYPSFFRQDPFFVQEAVVIDEDGSLSVDIKTQREITSFANQWIRNINEQQGLEVK